MVDNEAEEKEEKGHVQVDLMNAASTRSKLVIVDMAATQVCRVFLQNLSFSKNNLRQFKTGLRCYSTKKTIGFVGLGNMGRPMSQNLLKNEYPVVVYDVLEQAMEQSKHDGAKTATSPADLASKVDVVITMLPTNQHVLDCYQGPNGIFEGAKKDAIFIDSSTVDPSVSITIDKAATEKRNFFVDAPVSGGIIGAKDGTLTFMVGGEEAIFRTVKPILECMGSNIVYCGKPGSGQAAKICNNMLLGITMLGVSEALNLGQRLGLDPKLLTSIINTSTGKCWSSEKYNPVPDVLPNVPSSKGYEGGFMSKLMCKDLGLAQDIATRLRCSIPLGAATHQFYRLAISNGHGDKDFAYAYQMLKGKE